MTLIVVPISLKDANGYLIEHHRHNGPLIAAKFSIAACLADGSVVGVAVAGIPKARMLNDDGTLEVSRVCTDGTYNACSKLYGACVRAARAFGYWRVVTYTLEREHGTSLRASGWTHTATTAGESWQRRCGVPNAGQYDAGDKNRWEILLAAGPVRPVWPEPVSDAPTLFDFAALGLPLDGRASATQAGA